MIYDSVRCEPSSKCFMFKLFIWCVSLGFHQSMIEVLNHAINVRNYLMSFKFTLTDLIHTDWLLDGANFSGTQRGPNDRTETYQNSNGDDGRSQLTLQTHNGRLAKVYIHTQFTISRRFINLKACNSRKSRSGIFEKSSCVFLLISEMYFYLISWIRNIFCCFV